MFLEDQISEQLIMQLPGYIAIQDLDSKYVIANNLTLEALKLNSLDKIMGCKYEDMVFDVATCADVLRQQDQLAISTEKNIRFLSFHCREEDREWVALMGEKRVLRDNNNKVNGVFTHWTDITHFNILDIGKILLNSQKDLVGKHSVHQFGYLLTDESSKEIGLTNRQMECLFFMLRGKTNRNIADALGIGERTVEDHINEIKIKLKCTSKPECIEKAMFKGYTNMIPESLLNRQLKGMIQLD